MTSSRKRSTGRPRRARSPDASHLPPLFLALSTPIEMHVQNIILCPVVHISPSAWKVERACQWMLMQRPGMREIQHTIIIKPA